MVARESLHDAQVRGGARVDRCLRGIRRLGVISMAGRAARCDRSGDVLGDPDLPRLRPGRARRLHGLHADHAALPGSIAGSTQWPLAGGRVAPGDRRDRRPGRGVGHRADPGADRGPLLRRATHGDPRRQQLDRPNRRGRRGDGAASWSGCGAPSSRKRESGERSTERWRASRPRSWSASTPTPFCTRRL